MTLNGRREYWREKVGRWESEGGSRREYCKRHRLSYSAFGYWVQRLREIDSPAKVTCIELRPDPGLGMSEDDEGLVFDTDGITLRIGEPGTELTIRGRLSVARLRRIVAACGSTDVSA